MTLNLKISIMDNYIELNGQKNNSQDYRGEYSEIYILYHFKFFYFKVSQDDVITIDSDDDDNEVGSVGSEIILISDSEPEDHLFPHYGDEEEANLEESERYQDVKGTFPLVKNILCFYKKNGIRIFCCNFYFEHNKKTFTFSSIHFCVLQ